MRRIVTVLLILACVPTIIHAQEIRIAARDLGQATQRAKTPTPGKWWLQLDTDGGRLVSGKVADKKPKDGEWQVLPIERFIAQRVPTLAVDPKAKGWHKIYVGLVHDPVEPNGKLFARLSREPYPEYLVTPENCKTATAEVYWKAADLTDQKIHLEPPPAPMQHPGHFCFVGITHVRLVPMSQKEVEDAKKEIDLPPKSQRLFGMLDYTDEVFWWGTVEKEDDIRAIVYRHRESGFGRI